MDWNAIFGNVRWYLWPVLEIGLLSVLIYQALYYLRGARASYVLAGISMMLIALNLIAQVLEFQVINWLLDGFLSLLALIVVVIFQPEMRRAFAQLGSLAFWQRGRRREVLGDVAAAAVSMSQAHCGALIVIERRIRMQAIIDDAVKQDIRVTPSIIESIFYPKSALHDGAVIIRDDRIVAARAILPLTRVENVSRRWGTRHRAAIGITEETDAVAVVVSEETGSISVASGGRMRRRVPGDLLEAYLNGLVIREKTDAQLYGELEMEERRQQETRQRTPRRRPSASSRSGRDALGGRPPESPASGTPEAEIASGAGVDRQ